MAYRAFTMAKRLDVSGMNIQVLDLIPNSSQKSGSYDGQGQTFYLNCMDQPGTTKMFGNGYVSGSTFTSLDATYDAAADSTTGGVNNVLATPKAALGLMAYLRERVHPGGVTSATAGRLTISDAESMAFSILGEMGAGNSLTLSAINTILSDEVSNTDLDGASGTSKSFGAVIDILRILSGEVYRSPENCIICNQTNQFRSLGERNILVAAQDSATSGKTFVSYGGFLTNLENGYVQIPVTAVTGDLLASIGDGYLKTMNTGLTFKNPNFAYDATSVTPDKPRALAVTGSYVPSSGTMSVISIYNNEGENLL